MMSLLRMVGAALLAATVIMAAITAPFQFSGEQALIDAGFTIVDMKYNVTLPDGRIEPRTGTIQSIIKQDPSSVIHWSDPPAQPSSDTPDAPGSSPSSGGGDSDGSGTSGPENFVPYFLDCGYGEFVRQDIIAEGISYLRNKGDRIITIEGEDKECQRVSCSYNAAIYVCPYNGCRKGPHQKRLSEVADIADAIMNRLCPSSDPRIKSDTRGMTADGDKISVYVMRSLKHC